jgi:hypothetical protein
MHGPASAELPLIEWARPLLSLRSTIFMGPLGDQGELPIGAWATFLIARYPKLNANAAPQNWNHG